MHNGSTVKTNRSYCPDTLWGWLPVVVCLIILRSMFGVSCDHHAMFPHPCSQESACHTGCLTCAREGGETTFLTACGPTGKTDIRRLFAFPVETETPDFEPMMLKHKKRPVRTIVHLGRMPSALTPSVGAIFALYLMHQSLLC